MKVHEYIINKLAIENAQLKVTLLEQAYELETLRKEVANELHKNSMAGHTEYSDTD